MRLLLIISLLSVTEGFAPISRSALTSSPYRNHINANGDRCRQPSSLCSVQDDISLEETARTMFDVYCNDEKSMDLSALKGVPFVKDLLVSALFILDNELS